MGKKILFSPIGGNDPISSSTESDGSMLHICRIYKPDVVYLYLSKEMVERHNTDNRYGYCIEKLGELLNHKFEVHYILKEELVEVQNYDYYYEEYGKILQDIRKNMNSDDILLLNIASGTPAMKSSLFLLSVLYKNMVSIQVSTPSKSINKSFGKDDDYDPEYYWEINNDNCENVINRCTEMKTPNLETVLKKNIILKHVNSYNYTAAFMIANEIKDEISEEAYKILELAVARLQLDLSKVNTLSQKYNFDLLPVKQSGHSNIFEYVLSLQIKLSRKEYGDFIRAISPVLTDLFDIILKDRCKIDLKEYCEREKGVWCWREKKLKKTEKGKEILEVFNREFEKRGFREGPVSASNLKVLLLNYIDDTRLKANIEKARAVEEKVRNLAAHEIVSITEETLRKALDDKDITFNQIINLIKGLVVDSGIKVIKEDWKSYDTMNKLIEEYFSDI